MMDALYPLEIGYNHSAGIRQNIGYKKIPTIRNERSKTLLVDGRPPG